MLICVMRVNLWLKDWEEVERGEVSPGSFTIRNLAQRIENVGDPRPTCSSPSDHCGCRSSGWIRCLNAKDVAVVEPMIAVAIPPDHARCEALQG